MVKDCNEMLLFVFFKVCTKIVEKNANPEWNQLIHLQVKVGRVITLYYVNRLIKMNTYKIQAIKL